MDLAEMLGVNLNTVQKTFNELERENVINELINSFLLEMEVSNIHYEELITILKNVMNQKLKEV